MDRGHVYAGPAQLAGYRKTQIRHERLARGIGCEIGRRPGRDRGGKIDDRAMPARLHANGRPVIEPGERGDIQPQHGVELIPVRIGKRTRGAVPGIVDQHVRHDAARIKPGDEGAECVGVAEIDRRDLGTEGAGQRIGGGLKFGGVARHHQDRRTRCHGKPGGFQTDAIAGAGDEIGHGHGKTP